MTGLKYPKPKRKKTGKKPATVAEREYMARVIKLGCIVTGRPYEHGDKALTIHHDTKGGNYRNHYRVIPLENWLHLIQYGGRYSFHGNEKGWQEKHGSITFHLIKTYELLLNDGGLPEPAMKIYKELKEAHG